MKTRIIDSLVDGKLFLIKLLHRVTKRKGKFSFTTDLWTSGNKKAIMTITCTWISDNFEVCEVVLAFREIVGEHSGANIAKLFNEVMREYSIEENVWSRLSVNFILCPTNIFLFLIDVGHNYG